MPIAPGPGEPTATGWKAVPIDRVQPRPRSDRPPVLAIDGRSGSGKTTLAERVLRASRDGAVVVHIDDVAWNAPVFEWDGLLIDGVLAPLHEGRSVSYRPPAWVEHDRDGTIDVDASASLVIIEGVGAAQSSLAPYIDKAVWVQADYEEAGRRGVARDAEAGTNGDETESRAFWNWWMKAEVPFLTRERPWLRADLIVAGTPVLPLSDDELAVGTLPDLGDDAR